jgi:hypothetical protein
MDNITQEQVGTPILAADATFAVMKKDKHGIFLGFYVNAVDVTDEMLRADLGDVMRLWVTVPEVGA